MEPRNLTSLLHREAAAELKALVLRLEVLQEQLAAGEPVDSSVAVDAAEQLLAAIDDVRDIETVLVEHAAAFEEVLQAERRRYQDLFDRAPDAYLVTDAAGVILEANGAATALFGHPAAQLVGKPLPALIPTEVRRQLRRALLEVVHEPFRALELDVTTRSGPRCIEARAAVEQGDRGSLLVRWILRDVTGRKDAERRVKELNAQLEKRIAERTRELSDANERLQSLLQEMPQGVVILDAQGNVETANRRAEELTQKTALELQDYAKRRPWRMFDVDDGHELDEDERPVIRALRTGQAVSNRRVRVIREDGVELFLEFAAVPVYGPHGLHSVIATFQDVTEQEIRDRAERDFVTNAAHELQTPLAAIASAVEVLQSGAKDRDEDRDRFLSHIEHACERLDRLTRALLVLARAQTRAEPPRREVVPVEPLLRMVADSLPRDSGVEVAVDCEPEIAVIANRALLEQAVANLGHNALKHTRGQIHLGASRNDGRVEIAVRDSGPGIDEADRDHVFERFYRSGETAGFGLGLAIVAEAVKALDGELGFVSSESGTTFAITLPYARILGP